MLFQPLLFFSQQKPLSVNKSVAIITSDGFGDFLMMMVVANNLKRLNFSVTIFTDHPVENLFKGFSFFKKKDLPPLENFDLVILQNNNSKLSKDLIISRKGNLIVLYVSYKKDKHQPLDKRDFVFDQNTTFVDNLITFLKNYLPHPSKDIALDTPKRSLHRRYKKEVVIHPFASSPDREWRMAKFIKLYHKLERLNFSPIFIMKREERKNFPNLNIFSGPLSSLTKKIYEAGYFIGNLSGPSHLASYLEIPSIIISHDKEHLRIWQPGWKRAHLLFPNPLVPNIKWVRLKKEHWKLFISTKKVINSFKYLISR